MKKYLKKKRKNNEFKNKEIEREKLYNENYKNSKTKKIRESWQKASAAYRKKNPDQVKKLSKKASATYREANPEKVKHNSKESSAKYREANPEKVKHNSKESSATYREANPEKVKESCNKATTMYRQSKPEKVTESCRNSRRIYYQNYPERVKNIQKKNYLKRKLSYIEDENSSRKSSKRSKINSQDNLLETSEETSDDTSSPISIHKAIELFDKDISVGPEYTCACCDQLWYRSSVTECNASLYQSCSKEILNLCLTGLKSIDNSEWMCGTCHSNLKAGKLPSCAKANKMNFPEKPDVLKDLTPLEERRLILPRIPFMQLRELPSGGQLSIHGNVVNVPADVNYSYCQCVTKTY